MVGSAPERNLLHLNSWEQHCVEDSTLEYSFDRIQGKESAFGVALHSNSSKHKGTPNFLYLMQWPHVQMC